MEGDNYCLIKLNLLLFASLQGDVFYINAYLRENASCVTHKILSNYISKGNVNLDFYVLQHFSY